MFKSVIPERDFLLCLPSDPLFPNDVARMRLPRISNSPFPTFIARILRGINYFLTHDIKLIRTASGTPPGKCRPQESKQKFGCTVTHRAEFGSRRIASRESSERGARLEQNSTCRAFSNSEFR